ncbi:ADP-ribosylglycohydrolase family protein [Inquilinus sp. CA228]|uniref:ADP-ribosylglycohydrolase family protein n=1 Tax=Inquilinus sp. CA228 TaxID=3455609 RepID=UPI003F8D2AD8
MDDILTDAVIDRARGAFVGLAVGDALGTTLEFSSRDSRPHHREMTGGGPFGLAPGQWTDDTSMALALADSLITRGGFDATDLMDRFVAWWQDGRYSCTGACFDIGMATQGALDHYLHGGGPFAGSTDPTTAGNGSLMRLAPAVLHTLRDAEACRRIAAEQSRTTHGAREATEACVFFGDRLRSAILGAGKGEVLTSRPWDGTARIQATARGGWRGQPRALIESSGYVVHTLEAALWAVDRTDSFEDALILAVNLADDADSVGAVTGQLAGALYGLSGIPRRWLEPLAWRERIVEMADTLIARG